MSTEEEKIDLLITEVKALQVGQLKLTTTVDAINKWSINAEQMSVELSKELASLTSRMAALEAVPVPAPKPTPSHGEDDQANGHRKTNVFQGGDVRFPKTHHTLGKGELPNPKSLITSSIDVPEFSRFRDTSVNQTPFNQEYKLPKVDFPKFDGEHPQVWRDRCEKYFAMFSVPPHLWAPLATISFRGNAMLWLQTYEAQHTVDNWHELCVAVDKKFGRDLYQNYMRDLLNIRQTQDVLEYANRFEQAKHRVLVHNRDLDEVFFFFKNF